MHHERARLDEDTARIRNWKRWGPYLSERAWGTVREDYSADGTAWDYFPHDHARSRAYRWNEDGLLGICDRHQRICFALALWNGRDPDPEGAAVRPDRHRGQPRRGRQGVLLLPRQHADALVHAVPLQVPAGRVPVRAAGRGERAARTQDEPEFELLDTGVFDENRYFDVEVEYAKADADDILIRITVTNRGPEAASAAGAADDLVPQHVGVGRQRRARDPRCAPSARAVVELDRRARTATRWLYCEGAGSPALHRERDQHGERLFGRPRPSPLRQGRHQRVRGRWATPTRSIPAGTGTKAAADYALTIAAGATAHLRLRLTDRAPGSSLADRSATRSTGRSRRGSAEADEFYADGHPGGARRRRSSASCARRSPALLWSKQFYHYVVRDWLDGDLGAAAAAGGAPARPQQRVDAPLQRRRHLDARQVGVPLVRGLGPGVPLRRRWRSSIRSSPRSSSCCCCASGTCTRTGSCRPTSGRSAT